MNSMIGLRWFLPSILLFLTIWLSPTTADAQIVLYVEIMTEEKPIKYYVGQDLITFCK